MVIGFFALLMVRAQKVFAFSGLRESTNGATVGALLSSSLWA